MSDDSYRVEPVWQVSRIGGKPGQSRRVLGEAVRRLFDDKWRCYTLVRCYSSFVLLKSLQCRMIVTRELGFESLEEMQRARASEVSLYLQSKTGVS